MSEIVRLGMPTTRVTITIDDGIYQDALVAAAEHEKSVSAWISRWHSAGDDARRAKAPPAVVRDRGPDRARIRAATGAGGGRGGRRAEPPGRGPRSGCQRCRLDRRASVMSGASRAG